MFVSEKDIFNYVFYPDVLKKGLRDFITENKEIFQSEIEFYEMSKSYSSQSNKYEDDIVNRILNKNASKIIDFIKLESKIRSRNSIFLLNSATPNLEKTVVTETFVDKDSEYLVKVIIIDKITKVYVFNKNNTNLENFKLTLQPGNKTYELKDNQAPLILENVKNIENVKLEIL